jgi:AcrR family transcriptional regulator
MPKATFSTLPEKKRERILRVATDLFVERGFDRTDMGEISKRAGVAKGSLYNYFHSKDELFLYLCRNGIERFRQAVWGNIPPDWNIYQQVEHIFRRQVPLILDHPQNFQIYLNLSSSGMKRFANRYSREGEEFAAKRLKALLKEGIAQGVVRDDLDVPLTAFLINSLSIMFLASLISGHFQIRFKEYMGIKGDLDRRTAENYLERMIKFIHQLLRPINPKALRKRGAQNSGPQPMFKRRRLENV